MESIVTAIAEIKEVELLLSALRKSLEILTGIPTNRTPRVSASAEEHDGRYRDQKVGAALRRYMQDKKSATLDQIRDALDRGGIRWGKYPKRQVKLAVVNLPKVYAIKGNFVTLIPIS
jgi:hypothetical protein